MTAKESVWSYPRPPRCEPFDGHVEVIHRGVRLADSRAAFRVLETSHPPTFYIPPGDVDLARLRVSSRRSFCEWKGFAEYLDWPDVELSDLAWRYPEPSDRFRAIAGFLAFYAGPLDACRVNGERVRHQPGSFYGGWITDDIEGPFKGGPGTLGW